MDFLFIDGGALCWLDIFLVSYKEKKCLSMLAITEDSRYWLDGLFVY